MCGIYGIISRTNSGLGHEDDEILKQMMLDTVQRGDNSSGLFMTDYLDPHVEPTGVKVLGGPHNIIYNTPLWREVGNFIQRHAGAVIGHGRWATRGKVTAEHAHPFQYEHITLVHNGTIHGGVSYAKKGDVDIDVDSHALAVSMAAKGVLEALVHVRGAYAVVVHDSKEGCLYLARNDDRPLHVYTNATRHYIMSEGMFLDAILARYGKKIPDQHVMYFKAEQRIKIDLDKPAEYVVAGDIKIRREAIEAEERELRRKEAEANRKKYESSSKKHQGDAGKERSVSRLPKRAALLLVALVISTIPSSAGGVTPVEAFINGVLAGVDAVEIECPPQILAQTRMREMGAVCAVYDGDFQDFKDRWRCHLEGEPDGGRRRPQAIAHTPWRLSGGNYERIYSVGQIVIGFGFNQGLVVAVYR